VRRLLDLVKGGAVISEYSWSSAYSAEIAETICDRLVNGESLRTSCVPIPRCRPEPRYSLARPQSGISPPVCSRAPVSGGRPRSSSSERLPAAGAGALALRNRMRQQRLLPGWRRLREQRAAMAVACGDEAPQTSPTRAARLASTRKRLAAPPNGKAQTNRQQ
jgi:hypothetical protein